MGQVNSKPNEHDYSKFKEKYIVKKKTNDKKFGEALVIENITTKSDLLLKEFHANSSRDFTNIYNKISLRDSIRNPYIIEIIDYFTLKGTNCCSDYYKLYVVFEFCNKNLEIEIEDRTTQDQMRYFSNDEIIYLAESYITALAFLQKNQIPHGNISLQNLFISKNGIYKLADQTLLNLPSNYEQIFGKKTDTKGIYLSPEQIQVFLIIFFSLLV